MGITDLGNAGQDAVAEDIFFNPRVHGKAFLIGADGVQQKKAVLTEQMMGRIHEHGIVFVAHMLEHAHGNNALILPDQGTIVFQQPLHIQALAVALGILGLSPRNRDAVTCTPYCCAI